MQLPKSQATIDLKQISINGRAKSIVIFSILISIFITACFYGSPDDPGTTPGEELIVYPDKGGQMVSADSRLIVEFEAGTVSRPTTFSITEIPAENYPEQYLLRSVVYQIEPAKQLNKAVKITYDMTGLDGKDFNLTEIYGLNAIQMREMTPGSHPTYISSEETTIEAIDGSHQVLIRETDTPHAFGVFVQGCYAMCYKMISCPNYPKDDTKTSQQMLSECMAKYSCADFENMNSDFNESRYRCSYTRYCSDSFGCCLDDPPCEGVEDGDTDGDTEQADGDDDTETADGDDDTEAADGDEEGEDTRFEIDTCITAADCPEDDMVCVTDAKLDNNQTGFCMNVSRDLIEGYLYKDDQDAWVKQETQPFTNCAGDPPAEDASGDTTADLKFAFKDWWLMSSSTGITVEIFTEGNLNAPAYSGVTNDNGEFLVQNAVTIDEWFVIKTSRTDDDPMKEIVPTYTWGNFINQTEAKNSNTSGVPITVHMVAVDKNRWVKFAQFLNISEAELEGRGMVLGQTEDCQGMLRYSIKNASVGFLEAKPIRMGYFSNDKNNPATVSDMKWTSENGLFAAIYLPTLDQITAYAVGKVKRGESEELSTIGLTIEGHLKVIENSVSVVKFNHFH